MSKVICIVDNNKIQKSNLKTENGVAFWIETSYGNLLFDTGQTPNVLKRNFSILGLDFRKINAIALSHAHFDHTGGLEAVFGFVAKPSVFANPDVFHERFFLRDNKYEKIGFKHKKETYENLARLELNENPAEIFPNLWTSGVITLRDEPEGGDAHYIKKGDAFIRDPFKDDMSLVLKSKKGLVIICGCCHAGLLNTIAQVEKCFFEKIHAIIGGTHLMTADEVVLKHVIRTLKLKYQTLKMYLNHCSGSNAIKELKIEFGDQVQYFAAGSCVEFND